MPTETIPEITAAAEALLQRGVGNVLVTVGSRGALLCNRNGSHLYPAYPQKAVDTTAAGDTFNAAFAVALDFPSPVRALRPQSPAAARFLILCAIMRFDA